MALTDLTRISTSGIATGSTIDSPILRKDVDFRGDKVGVTSALFDSSEKRLDFKDNVKLRFGDSGDLSLYHEPNNSFIKNTTGQLALQTPQWGVQGIGTEGYNIYCIAGQQIQLYYAGNKKFETTSTGVVVTGILTATSFSGGGGISAGVVTCTGLDLNGNGDVSGNFVIGGDLTVNGTTTTLDTNLTEVDRIEVGANSNTLAGIAVTQSGSADIVRLYDGASQVVTVDDEGKVGLGTNNPSSLLQVDGDVTIKDASPAIFFIDDAGVPQTPDYRIQVNTGNFVIKDDTNSATRLLINSAGRVGIGTDDPARILDVNGTVRISNGASIEWGGTSASIAGESSSNTLFFRTASEERLRITSDGKVGINTNSPTLNGNEQGIHIVSEDYPTLHLTNSTTGHAASNGSMFTLNDTGETIIRNGHASHIRFDTNNGSSVDERLRIDSNGRLLLGTTTEGHVDADDFTIGTSTNSAGITIRTNTSGVGRLFFSDGTSGAAEYQGYIQYDHNNQRLSLGSGGDTRLLITSTGLIRMGNGAAANTEASITAAIFQNVTGTATILKLGNTNTPSSANNRAIEFCDGTGGTEGSSKYTYARIKAERAGGSNSGRLIFSTKPNNNDGPQKAIEITPDGDVLIGNGNVTTQEGDGRLIVYANTRLHPAIKADCIDGGSNRANGFTMLADNYGADESLSNIGLSYSGAGLVISRGVKVSNASDNVYLSSTDAAATKPCAIKLDNGSVFRVLNTNTSATVATDSPVTLHERFRITQHGTTQVNSICPRIFSPNTGSTNGNYWKIGSVTLNGSEGFILTFCGTGGYSAGQQIAASTKVTARCSNGSTLVGYMTGESHGSTCGIEDVRWKHEGSNVFSIWAKVQHYTQITPLVKLFGDYGGWQPDSTNTGSTSAPSGSTAFDKYAYKQVGGVNTIQYTANDTHFLENIRMANDKGIDFSAETNEGSTSQNTLLADYEEGTWTPTNSIGLTLTNNNTAHYIKIGKQVTVWFDLTLTGNPDSAQCAAIQSLPYVSKATNSFLGQSNSVWYSNTGDAKRDYDDDNTLIFVNTNSTTINLWNVTGGHIRVRAWANGRRFRGTVTYIAKN